MMIPTYSNCSREGVIQQLPVAVLRFVLLLLVVSTTTTTTTTTTATAITAESNTVLASTVQRRSIVQQMTREIRRRMNLGSTFGTVRSTSQTPYDRIIGQPVFAITTPWGSPYMNMEKLTDQDEVWKPDMTSSSASFDGSTSSSTSSTKKKLQSLSEEQNEYRMIALYFCDPDDAISTHSEMKQMSNMMNADVRLTVISLGKALRQASNLGHGLVTGIPPDSQTGSYNPPEDGSMLRYKIVPSKRQLYYAARCYGKERVGLLCTNPIEDAQAAVLGNGAIEALNLLRRREKRERKTPKKKTTTTAAASSTGKNKNNGNVLYQMNQHMEGHTGIPVFYIPGMYKKLPYIQRILNRKNIYEVPLFFNYEDLIDTWNSIKVRQGSASATSSFSLVKKQSTTVIAKTDNDDGEEEGEPPMVEVFNLWDVLTSMDKYMYQQKQKRKIDWKKKTIPFVHMITGRSSTRSSIKSSTNNIQNNIQNNNNKKKKTKKKNTNDDESELNNIDLNSIVFVPNSRCVQYKDSITVRGNSKARLRPMRNYQ